MPACTTDSETRHWPVLLASFAATSLTHGLASCIGVFYIEWHNEFSDSENTALVGWLSTSMLAMLLCVSPFAGALIKYFGVRPVVVAGSLLSFSGLLIASFAHEIFVLFITIPFMAGIGFGMCYTGLIVHISECFHKHYALATGITMAGASIGMMVLPLVINFLIDQYGWRGALMVISALQANVFVCARIMRAHQMNMRKHKKPLRHSKTNINTVAQNMSSHGTAHLRRSEDNSPTVEVTGTDNPSWNRSVIESTFDDECITTLDHRVSLDPHQIEDSRLAAGRLADAGLVQQRSCGHKVKSFFDHAGVSLFWTNRVFSSFVITTMTIASVNGITLPYLVAHAKSVGIPEIKAILLLSVIGLFSIVSRLTHGRLVDANVIQPMYIYIISVAFSTIAAPLIAVVQSYAGFVVCAAMIGVSSGVFIPLQAVLICQMVGRERFPGGFGTGLVFVAVGNMTSAYLGGYLYDATDSYSAGFYFLGILAGLTVALVLGLHVLWTRLVPDDRWPRIT